MPRTQTSLFINAPVDIVFARITDVNVFTQVNPDVINVEFLSEQRSGLGTKFKETRLMNARETTTELEITEYKPNAHARFVSDAGGTIWDTLFTTQVEGAGTQLEIDMEARPYKFMSKIITPLIMGMVSKAVKKDLDGMKTYCESIT